MRSVHTNRVIVTSLAFTLLLSGVALSTSRQQALAEPSEKSVLQQQGPTEQKQERGEKNKESKNPEKGERHSLPILEEAAAILNMDKATLSASLKEKSLVELAKEKGISEADLIDKLKTMRSKKIDEAVKAGKLTAEQAEKMKANMEKHLKFMVNHKGGFWHGKHGMRHKMLPAPDKLASIIGISEDQLKTQLKEGKSLVEIAAAKGIGKDQLVTKIKDEMTPWIEKMVEHKRGSQQDKN
ncbi:DUF2680 domain-containing protein [Paenibacillus sp. RC67]|uniref:DUF2680 domain-containing protein n=1 Tax=Paenibacillus sp. RC67 TaxID=3039392 RepID=UPI0024AE2AA3|nr:DUF2680 domain-containing protein [Paenibacillus sp. RC67]